MPAAASAAPTSTDAMDALSSDASGLATAANSQGDFYAGAKLNVARRAVQQLQAKADTLQVLFALTCPSHDPLESAAAAAQKLATAGVLAMIGPNASRNAIPASVVAESSLMPMISPWSTNPKTTKVGDTDEAKKFVFRAAFIDDFQGVVAAKFAMDQLKTTKPAVLYDVASEYNKGIAEIYKRTLEENGIQVVSFETYTTGDKDSSAQLTKIKDAGADSLFCGGPGEAPCPDVFVIIECRSRLTQKGDVLHQRSQCSTTPDSPETLPPFTQEGSGPIDGLTGEFSFEGSVDVPDVFVAVYKGEGVFSSDGSSQTAVTTAGLGGEWLWLARTSGHRVED